MMSQLTHGLLAHSALVGVSGRLVVVRVGDQTSTHPQDGERLNLQMCCGTEASDSQSNNQPVFITLKQLPKR